MRRRQLLLAAGAAFLSACARTGVPAGSPKPPAAYPAALAANAQLDVWPAMYRSAPSLVQKAYRYAAQHEAGLRYIPCYCGCGLSAGHLSNYDCFVSDAKPDGWVKLDAHGLNCGTCVAITIEVAGMRDQGLQLRAIRTAIDARWSATGPSTRTPYP